MPQVAALINIDQLMTFLDTPFAKRLQQHADTLQREATFAMIMPANRIYDTLTDDAPVLLSLIHI